MFNLTKEEKLALIFIIACLLIGATASYYKKRLFRFARNDTGETVIASPTKLVPAKTRSGAKQPFKININTGNINDLIKLKGIGVKTAERIIEYRQVNGHFFFKEDAMKVKGIGKTKFDSIKDNIVVK